MAKRTLPKKPKTLEQQLARIANTDAGIDFLRYLMSECGYQRPSAVICPDSGAFQLQTTALNEGRRNLWLQIRQKLSDKHLTIIEIDKPVLREEKQDAPRRNRPGE